MSATQALFTADGIAVGAYRAVAGVHTTASATDTIAVAGINRVLSVTVTPLANLSDDLIGATATWTDGAANTREPASVVLKTWKNTSGSDPTPAAATSFGVALGYIVVGV